MPSTDLSVTDGVLGDRRLLLLLLLLVDLGGGDLGSGLVGRLG